MFIDDLFLFQEYFRFKVDLNYDDPFEIYPQYRDSELGNANVRITYRNLVYTRFRYRIMKRHVLQILRPKNHSGVTIFCIQNAFILQYILYSEPILRD